VANYNRVMMIGRLTRDSEVRTFQSGGKVCVFGFATNNRKRNQQSGQWEDDPVFLDCEGWNRGEQGKLADRLSELKKGAQIHIEGHLKLDQWSDQQSGQQRQKIKVVVDSFQYLDARQQDGNSGYQQGGQQSFQQPQQQRQAAPRQQPQQGYQQGGSPQQSYQQPQQQRQAPPTQHQGGYNPDPFGPESAGPPMGEEEIPF
jgi:single-strand DNA-binding protein